MVLVLMLLMLRRERMQRRREEGGAHDEDTATEEDADDEFSVFIFIFSLVLAAANFLPRTDVRTGAMLIGLWRAGERESRQGRHPCCG